MTPRGVWLRTGDLGFQDGGELFITGRRKDMLIVRGQNVYPQDVEETVAAEVILVRAERVAAFAVDGADGEGIGVAAEMSRREQRLARPEAVARAIAEAVAEAHGEPPVLILLLDPGTLPLTSSGKRRRAECLRAWRAGSLTPFAVFGRGAARDGGAPRSAAPLSPTAEPLAAMWREILEVDQVRSDDSFFALGGSSLAAVQLAARVADELGVALEARSLFRARTLAELAAEVDRPCARWGRGRRASRRRRAAASCRSRRARSGCG